MNLDKCFVLNISKKISAENQAIYDSQHERHQEAETETETGQMPSSFLCF